MKLELEAKSTNEGFARYAVSAFLAPLDPSVAEIADIRTVVSEAVTNCIVHAYKEGTGKIYIRVSWDDKRCVRIRIKDRGCGIEDLLHTGLTDTVAAGDLPGQADECAGLLTDSIHLFQFVQRRFQHLMQTAEPGQQFMGNGIGIPPGNAEKQQQFQNLNISKAVQTFLAEALPKPSAMTSMDHSISPHCLNHSCLFFVYPLK